MSRERAGVLVKRKPKNSPTCLGLIVYIFQNSPEKRLTASELIDAMMTFVDVDRKGIENNVRVCLSTNDCFVKVPVDPMFLTPKRNLWKVDETKITPKMLRRHFRCFKHIFPAFYKHMENHIAKQNPNTTCKRPEAEKKFTSSFSIESLLQRESSAPVRLTPVLGEERKFENEFLGIDYGCGLGWKRKAWDIDFSGSYAQMYFPTYNMCHFNGRGALKMHSVSELSCFTPEDIWEFTLRPTTGAYM